MRRFCALFLVLALCVNDAWATVYYLDNTNMSASNGNPGTNQALPWSTLTYACSILDDGDTLIIVAGSYEEVCTPAHSGSAGLPVTFEGTITGGTSWRDGGTYAATVKRFVLNNRGYITIKNLGFSMTGFAADTARTINVGQAAHHIEIIDNYFHDVTAGEGVVGSGTTVCSFVGVRRNKIANNGALFARQEGAKLFCNDSIIEDNDISGVNDFTQPLGARNVVRRNVFHDSSETDAGGGAHIDGVQGICNSTATDDGNNNSLYEQNVYRDNIGDNAHFYLANTNLGCGTQQIIIRGNVTIDAAVFVQVDTNNQDASSASQFIYNNSTLRAGRSNASYASGTHGAAGSFHINNIFQDILLNSPWGVVRLHTSDVAGTNNDWNMAYNSSSPPTWGLPFSAEANRKFNEDPLFVSTSTSPGVADLHLQATSPAKQSGGPLTTVAVADTSAGTTLILTNVGFFQPGWAGVEPDEIAIGTRSNTARISSINYATNTITLVSGVTRNDGDPVWLYKDSGGAVVLFGPAGPDRGAFQTNWGAPTTIPISRVGPGGLVGFGGGLVGSTR